MEKKTATQTMTAGDMLHFTNRLKRAEDMQDNDKKDSWLANLQSDIEGIYGQDMIDPHAKAIHQAVVEARS